MSINAPTPNRPLLCITRSGAITLAPSDISPSRIGWKAFGLAAIPEDWTLPFFLIEAGAVESLISRGERQLETALASIVSGRGSEVIVRSSGTQETLLNRGQLVSSYCTQSEVIPTLRKLVAELAPRTDIQNVHWIVQVRVEGRGRGHFSNERRLSYEKRDWILEVEPHGSSGSYATPVAVRQWRDGSLFADDALRCASEAQLSLTLKNAAIWAGRFRHRFHFEWVWDGARVYIVQADQAYDLGGSNPQDVLTVDVPSIQLSPLASFRSVNDRDFAQYSKLRNAATYRELGYDMPQFYILEDGAAIEALLNGEVSSDLVSDLMSLTRRPLIIRTDGVDIPADKREMLPRSEELRSVEEAVAWLSKVFPDSIRRSEIPSSGLVLIAHHFIPALASAWASSEPGRPIVRVESLWGIPDGLYWFSHDTFEVDTESGRFDKLQPYSGSVLEYAKRIRYKGMFVGPDHEGHWITNKTAVPFDWRPTIRSDLHLSEIAWTTRRIAEREGYPVAVMWFVQSHSRATAHGVMPWFHTRYELQEEPQAAPRGKYRRSRDLHVTTIADWREIRNRDHPPRSTERLIVEPHDASLIRDPSFVSELAGFAKERSITIELYGGLLSHAYYMLDRKGVKVECVDLFGQYEDVVEFDKLVRDKVPSVIISKGERAATIKLAGDALIVALKRKLVEEAFEALDTNSGAALVEELADVIEVVYAVAAELGVTLADLDNIRKGKARKRGSFREGIMLVSTGSPGSLARSQNVAAATVPLIETESAPRVITDPGQLPTRRLRRRPDLRQTDAGEAEKLLSLDLELSALKEVTQELEFQISKPGDTEPSYRMTVNVSRDRGAIKVISRLRWNVVQLDFLDRLGA